jgi:hypothetical protein
MTGSQGTTVECSIIQVVILIRQESYVGAKFPSNYQRCVWIRLVLGVDLEEQNN